MTQTKRGVKFTLDKRNYRKHGDANKRAIRRSLSELGAGRSVLADADGSLIAGNGVFEQAKALKIPVRVIETDGSELVVVQRTDLHTDDDKRKMLALADNATQDLSEWDEDVLREDWERDTLSDWGVELSTPPLDEEPQEEGEKPKPDAAPVSDDERDHVPQRVKHGDIWRLGDHFLRCGDSTNEEDVLTLMQGEKADLVFTDPPYGVNVKGRRGKGNTIAGDLTQVAIPFAFELAVTKATKDEAFFYFCGGEQNYSLYAKLFDRHLAQLPKVIVWVKNSFTLKHAGYHNQYEFIFHGYKAGCGDKWYGSRGGAFASDVWQVPRDNVGKYWHPTQKPLALALAAINNHSQPGAIVYEPFGGSGCTLLACEQTGRKCYAQELDENYCNIILYRWEKMTGKKAEKICEKNL